MSCNQPPGSLRLVCGQPNPYGASPAELYLLEGDATAAPITRIVLGEGVELPQRCLTGERPTRLKLLHFNDLHGHLASFGAVGPVPVFSRIASWLRGIRLRYAEDRHVVVLAVSIGDEIGGAIFDELLGESPESYRVHAAYRLYSQLGIDAGVLGNHDFDKGPSLLAHAIHQDARFPILAANVTANPEYPGVPEIGCMCYPAALFVVKGLRVGFIGLTTQAQLHLDPADPVRIADPVQTALNLLPAVRPLCDVLIILSHLGFSLDEHRAFVSVAGDVELARRLPPNTVHLIVGGHTHHVLNETGLSAANIVNGIPIVQAGQLGHFVGEVDISVQADEFVPADESVPTDESSRVVPPRELAAVTHVRLTSTADLPVDAAFEQEYVQPLLELARPFWDRKLGRVAQDEDMTTDSVRNAFAARESALANFITDALVAQCHKHGYGVDFAMIDASSVRCGLRPGGEVTFGDWFALMPFADTLCLFRMSGHQLHALLADNALRIARFDEPNTERGFLHFSAEVRYAVVPGFARTQARVSSVEVDFQPIEDQREREFFVASTSFVRGPAAAWEAYARQVLHLPLVALDELPHVYTHLYVRDLLVAYIVAHGGVLASSSAQRDGRLEIRTPFVTMR